MRVVVKGVIQMGSSGNLRGWEARSRLGEPVQAGDMAKVQAMLLGQRDRTGGKALQTAGCDSVLALHLAR